MTFASDAERIRFLQLLSSPPLRMVDMVDAVALLRSQEPEPHYVFPIAPHSVLAQWALYDELAKRQSYAARPECEASPVLAYGPWRETTQCEGSRRYRCMYKLPSNRHRWHGDLNAGWWMTCHDAGDKREQHARIIRHTEGKKFRSLFSRCALQPVQECITQFIVSLTTK